MAEDDVRPARGRPRQPQADDRIARATLALLQESGPEAVSVAAVAARSGVARTTIYRRYRDRQELLESALLPVTVKGAPPAGSDLPDKVAWVLARTAEVLEGGIGRGGVAALFTDRDPEFSAAARRALEEGLAPVRAQVTLDAAQGTLPEDVDPDLLLDLLLGAHLARTLRSGGATEDWRARTVLLLARLLDRPSGA